MLAPLSLFVLSKMTIITPSLRVGIVVSIPGISASEVKLPTKQLAHRVSSLSTMDTLSWNLCYRPWFRHIHRQRTFRSLQASHVLARFDCCIPPSPQLGINSSKEGCQPLQSPKRVQQGPGGEDGQKRGVANPSDTAAYTYLSCRIRGAEHWPQNFGISEFLRSNQVARSPGNYYEYN